MRFNRLATALVAGIAAVVPITHAAAASSDNQPKKYYLALGDSLAFGFHQAQFLQELATNSYDPASFNTGYVDDFATRLRTIRPNIQTVNLSCPGETSTSLVNGGCPFHNPANPLPLHANYPVTTPQLTAAVAFLHAHPGKVSPITVDIGGNDLLNLQSSCGGAPGCIQAGLPGVLGSVGSNLDATLRALHGASPSSEIIVVNYADPYEYVSPATIPVFGALNSVIGAVATSDNARLADVFTPALGFSAAQFCTLDAICAPPLYDIHPTDAGYAVMADIVWQASGYADGQDPQVDGSE